MAQRRFDGFRLRSGLPTWLVGLAALIHCSFPASAEGVAQERPHILLILADDLGWRDVGYHGSEIATPNIDRIASEGIELDRFYAQPSCSPTRTALMTGKSPLRLGMDRPVSKNERTGLPLDEAILPEYFARLGYRPMLVGKWHLGHYTTDMFPQARGFEHFYGGLTGGLGYWDHNHGGGHDWQRNGVTLREEGYTTHLIVEEAVRLLDANTGDEPLFLVTSFYAPHLPNEAPTETIESYRAIENEPRRVHAAMVSELDTAIGRLLDELERRGMRENTLVFFASDNGGSTPAAFPPLLKRGVEGAVSLLGRPLPLGGLELLAVNVLDGASDNRPLPKGKGSVAEGGSRVPAVVWWPGHLSGGSFEGFMTASDVLPTLLEAVGAADHIPGDLNGASQWSALRDEGESATPDYVTSGLDGIALYRAPWKLIATEPPALYQIYEDPLETRDVSAEHPELVAELVAAAAAWPRGTTSLDRSFLEIFLDPDSFGGGEDRAPWADVARDRAEAERAR